MARVWYEEDEHQESKVRVGSGIQKNIPWLIEYFPDGPSDEQYLATIGPYREEGIPYGISPESSFPSQGAAYNFIDRWFEEYSKNHKS